MKKEHESLVKKEIPAVHPLVQKAYDFAKNAHKGLKRKSGEEYFSHCEAVYLILRDEWGITNPDYLSAALLHDVVEDTQYTAANIEYQFNPTVAKFVLGVTNLGSDDQTLKKIASNNLLNPGTTIIKLADRLHNMRTLEFMSRDKQIKKSKETLDIYARLAESLGLWKVKTELEDLCFSYLDPDKYQSTKDTLDSDPRLSDDFLAFFKSKIEQLASDNSLPVEVFSRKIGAWYLLDKQNKAAIKGHTNPDSFSDINDVVSFRVVLPKLEDCYCFLSDIHQHFGGQVDHQRLDEFIGSNKRTNGYQAIQTTINSHHGPVEIALVTQEMEEFNNWGVVSLINNQANLTEYTLKLCFTPTGSIRFLPRDATGVDFAASLNPEVLARATNLTIDNQSFPLSVVLPNAATVRINLGEPRRAPLAGAEDYAAMPQTRQLIESQRNLERKDNLISKGQSIIEEIISPRGLLDLSDLGDTVNPILYKLGCQGLDDLYFIIGSTSLKPEVFEKELDAAKITKENLSLSTLRVTGTDAPGILLKLVYLIDGGDKNSTSEDSKDSNPTNILRVDQKNIGEKYTLRFLLKDMPFSHQKYLRKLLQGDPVFDQVILV